MLFIGAAGEKFENFQRNLVYFLHLDMIDHFSLWNLYSCLMGEGVYPPFSLTAVFQAPGHFFEAEYMYTSPGTGIGQYPITDQPVLQRFIVRIKMKQLMVLKPWIRINITKKAQVEACAKYDPLSNFRHKIVCKIDESNRALFTKFGL